MTAPTRCPTGRCSTALLGHRRAAATWVALHHGGGVGMGIGRHSAHVDCPGGVARPAAETRLKGASAVETTRPPARCAMRTQATGRRPREGTRQRHGLELPTIQASDMRDLPCNWNPGQSHASGRPRLPPHGAPSLNDPSAHGAKPPSRGHSARCRRRPSGPGRTGGRVYGVNTGLDPQAHQRQRGGGELEALQRNLIRSHLGGRLARRCSPRVVRLMLPLKAGLVRRAATRACVQWRVFDTTDIVCVLTRAWCPYVPSAGLWWRVGRPGAAVAHDALC